MRVRLLLPDYHFGYGSNLNWDDLLDIAKGIDARMLFPIHTDHPDAYKKITDRITIVEKAKKYEL